jgi:hypothetical protein
VTMATGVVEGMARSYAGATGRTIGNRD